MHWPHIACEWHASQDTAAAHSAHRVRLGLAPAVGSPSRGCPPLPTDDPSRVPALLVGEALVALGEEAGDGDEVRVVGIERAA